METQKKSLPSVSSRGEIKKNTRYIQPVWDHVSRFGTDAGEAADHASGN